MLEALIWGIFGCILGSFTNVLILRYAEGKSLGGRSACPSCHRTLAWFELVPVFSWIALRGKCRTCRTSISLQYPSVELLTGVLAALIGASPAALSLRIIGVGIAILLVAITVYDMKHTIIPDRWSFSFGVLALLSGFLMLPAYTVWSLSLFLLSGPIVALPLAAMWYFSDGRWMGLGDAKFSLGTGWLLGILPGYVSLMLSFVIGAVVGVCILLPLPYIMRILHSAGITRLRRGGEGFTMKSEVPFGPFLVLSLCIIWISALYDLNASARILDFLSLSSWW